MGLENPKVEGEGKSELEIKLDEAYTLMLKRNREAKNRNMTEESEAAFKSMTRELGFKVDQLIALGATHSQLSEIIKSLQYPKARRGGMAEGPKFLYETDEE